jgi:DNA-binding MarR family transcriptional regulator
MYCQVVPNVAVVDDLTLVDDLFAAIGLLRRLARRRVGQPYPQRTLAESHRELLRFVRRNPECSVAEAAAELGLAANTVSTLVRQLTDMGLLIRTADPTDRRVARLGLTDAARLQVAEWRRRRAVLAAQALQNLGPDERSALVGAIPVMAQLAAEFNSESLASLAREESR